MSVRRFLDKQGLKKLYTSSPVNVAFRPYFIENARIQKNLVRFIKPWIKSLDTFEGIVILRTMSVACGFFSRGKREGKPYALFKPSYLVRFSCNGEYDFEPAKQLELLKKSEKMQEQKIFNALKEGKLDE